MAFLEPHGQRLESRHSAASSSSIRKNTIRGNFFFIQVLEESAFPNILRLSRMQLFAIKSLCVGKWQGGRVLFFGSGVTLSSPALLGGDQGQSEDHVASCAQWEGSGLWTARWARLRLICTLSHFLGGAEPGQGQEGTEAVRTTTPPGKHTWPVPALYISLSPIHL